MKTIKIHKATGFNENELNGVTINIDTPLDDVDYSNPDLLEESLKVFQSDAKLLFDAIINTLPGGTIDQLLILLLQEKTSRFIVPIRSKF